MRPSKRRRNLRAAELRTPDHFPVCSRCGDYSEIDATICHNPKCSYRLLPTEEASSA